MDASIDAANADWARFKANQSTYCPEMSDWWYIKNNKDYLDIAVQAARIAREFPHLDQLQRELAIVVEKAPQIRMNDASERNLDTYTEFRRAVHSAVNQYCDKQLPD